MSDLISRLRANTWVMSCWATSDHLYAGMRSAMNEAADDLEAKDKRIAELEAEVARLRVDGEAKFQAGHAAGLEDAAKVCDEYYEGIMAAKIRAMKP